MFKQVLSRILCALLVVQWLATPLGCRNPANSNLPPTAIAPPGTPIPPLPKGDAYADETSVSPDVPIEAGDTIEIQIRRGAGEEKYTSVVREHGYVSVSFLEVEIAGLTSAQAETRIQERVTPYMRNPKVQVHLKKRVVRLKRFFVFGDVKKPGVYPLPRNMTVMQALATADSYQETALLDEIRIIRGNLDRPEILTADVARAFTYGDLSRNLSIQENDIVFVPREHLGDATQAANKVIPIITATIYPLFSVAYFATLGAAIGQ